MGGPALGAFLTYVIWALQVPLALVLLISGGMKLVQREELLLANMPWAEDFSSQEVKIIGGIEVAAAAGLILPGVLNFLTVLTPITACGVVLLMIGAIVVHSRRWKFKPVPINLVLLVIAGVVAWTRFGPVPF